MFSWASLLAQMVKKICLQCRRPGFNPIPWRRTWQPTPIFLPGEVHGHTSLAGTIHRVAKSQPWLSNSHFHVLICLSPKWDKAGKENNDFRPIYYQNKKGARPIIRDTWIKFKWQRKESTSNFCIQNTFYVILASIPLSLFTGSFIIIYTHTQFLPVQFKAKTSKTLLPFLPVFSFPYFYWPFVSILLGCFPCSLVI